MTRRQFLLSTSAAAATRPPNIVLILADDLGYGDLGCYGGQVPTPCIDQLAAGGIRFTQAYVAAPICSPSRVGITTGHFPARHLIFSFLNDRASNRALGMADYLDPRVPAIARTLRQSGYATGHFGKWHMGGGRDVDDAPLPHAYGFDESFTSFEGLGDRVLPPGALSEQSARLGRGTITRAPKSQLTRLFVDRAISFIDANRARPFYLQLWPDDVHDPFAPDETQFTAFARFSANKYQQQFAAVLNEMDRQVGRLVEAVRVRGLLENTLFVFLGDNGPTAWPRYYKESLDPPGSTGGLRGRKWSLYEGGIRTPLIVNWPRRVPAGKVDHHSVISSLDFFATFCRLAGVANAPPTDGEDMSAAFLGRRQQRKRDLFWEYGRAPKGFPYPGLASDKSPNCAIRSGNWKLLQNADGTGAELYSLAPSPDENRPVNNPRVQEGLSRKLLAWRNALPKMAL
ncbi:MAG: sulfatase-like hydrolase/transferase [Bryobacterales bacterium]|nr:sulfatase-like hydrolase/transferase [Bryobacterales bacterium]